MALGKKVKELLQQKNMTIKELAEKIGVPATTLYSFISRDSKTGKLDLLEKICIGLNIELDDLLESDTSTFARVSQYNVAMYEINNTDLHSEYNSFDRYLLLDFFEKLNHEGRQEVLRYIETLAENSQYQKTPDTPE